MRLDYVKALKQRETIPRIAAMIVHRDNLIKKTKSGVDKLTCIISDGSADVTMTILGAKVSINNDCHSINHDHPGCQGKH